LGHENSWILSDSLNFDWNLNYLIIARRWGLHSLIHSSSFQSAYLILMALANEQFSLFHGMDNLASYALRDLKESQHMPKNISEKSL